MTKFVVSNIELIKKDYIVEAYTKEAAQEKAHLQPPRTRISLKEITPVSYTHLTLPTKA